MGSQEPAVLSPIVLPLAISQREVWLDQRAWPESTHLNIGGGVFLRGTLDDVQIKAALQLLVCETEALRLVPMPDGTQRLLIEFEPTLELVDLPAVQDTREAMCEWCRHRMSAPFTLGERPPWRFALLRSSMGLHCLSIQFHHLVMDGWGTTLLIRRWGDIYTALVRGQPLLPAVGAPYQQFVEESKQYRRSLAFARDAAYWRQQLDALTPRSIEQREVQRDSRVLPQAHVVAQSLERPDYDQLCQYAMQRGYTAFGCFLTALALYLWRTRRREELVIGVPCLNRAGQRFKHTPGMFVGLLALRLRLAPGMSASQLLDHARQQMQAALRHARYPLSELGIQLQPMRLGRDSLMDALLSFERQDYRVQFGAADFVESRQIFAGTARYPLAVTVCEFDPTADLELVIEATAANCERDEAEMLGRRLWWIARQLAADPELLIGQLDIMPQEERWAVLEGLHKDLAQLAEMPPTFVERFEHQAALRPEACAVVWDGGAYSYAELNRRAAALAVSLRAAGAAPECVVAMAVPRSPDMVVALLAVAKSGAAFLPLDVDAPEARLREILQDSGAVALLLSRKSPQGLEALHTNVLRVPQLDVATDDVSDWPKAGPDNLAYVIYTSGSSGKPKGVQMPHGSLSRRLAWLAKTWAIDSLDRALQTTQLIFDPALIELLLPLTQGASVALPPSGRLHPERLAELLLVHGATFCAVVPSTLAGMLNGLRGRERERLKLRVACCGGEVLPPELANRFLVETGAQLYNVYGPTEAAIFATAWRCVPTAGESPLPLGRPVDDTRIYVLDESLQPQPFGVTGEVFIGGNALARGYLARPELTDKHFLPDPFRADARMYRTFDRGWLDCQGQLHFAGRADRQIKLRSYRIEPGDVEAACLTLPGVQQAVVQKVEHNGVARLHAWLGGQVGLTSAEVQAALRTRLPDYMVPAGISLAPALPINGSGKIDLRALSVPPVPPTGAIARRGPSGALEVELLRLWEQVLRVRPIHVHDNFFDLGGDSLAALGILGAMEDRLGRHFPLQLISEHPTIEQLAAALGAPQTLPGVLQRLSEKSDAPALYLAASGYGDVLRFQTLARALEGAMDVYMLQPPHGNTPESMADLAEVYANSIAAQGLVPGWLAGFSVGGVAALETACLLHERGLAPLGLILLDTIHPQTVLGSSGSWSTLDWLVRKLHVQELTMNGRRLGAMFSDPGLIAQVKALRAYRSRGFDGPCLLIKSSGLASWDRLLFKPWRHVMPNRISEQVVGGLHGSIFEVSHVDELAQALKRFVSAPVHADVTGAHGA